MILLSGGTDGGTITHVVELAEYIAAANPKPRLGMSFLLPVVYAGNKDVREKIKGILAEKTSLHITENIRPTLEKENLFPARKEIQKLFLEHVMAQAPGYKKLMSWTSAPIMPTPAAVGLIMQTIARKDNINVVGVDIGGATTDVFSVYGEIFNRTVSANLGMSYSISNVLAEAGLQNILRWVPFEINESDLRNRIKNKMVRPTTIPQTLEELKIEQAISREALRLSFEQHKSLAVGLKGVQRERDISEALKQDVGGETIVDMEKLDLLVGSGGVLSHAPRRSQSMLILIDAFQPEGITRIAVDSIFMMPHLGVLSSINEQAATEVFMKDCLIHLGTCISLKKGRPGKPNEHCVSYTVVMPDGKVIEESLSCDNMRVISLDADQTAEIKIEPSKNFDVGAGKGRPLNKKVFGGVVGVVIDTRSRPISLAREKARRVEQLKLWTKSIDAYPL